MAKPFGKLDQAVDVDETRLLANIRERALDLIGELDRPQRPMATIRRREPISRDNVTSRYYRLVRLSDGQ